MHMDHHEKEMILDDNKDKNKDAINKEKVYCA